MKVSGIKDCISLKDYLDSMTSWSQTWKPLFKDSKCTEGCALVNLNSFIFTRYVSAITNRNIYKDQGVLMSSDLTWDDDHDLICRAYKLLGIPQDLSKCQHHCFEENSLLVACTLPIDVLLSDLTSKSFSSLRKF